MFHISSFSSENFKNIQLGLEEIPSKGINYKTVIIGENGTGKTRLLNEIISAVREKYNDKLQNSSRDTEILTLGRNSSFERIVAISTSFNDKLPFSNNEKFYDEHYQYCGIRETSNASWTSSLMRKTLDNLLVCIESNQATKINKILDFLSLSNKIRITFKLRNTKTLSLLECNKRSLINYVNAYSNNTSRMQVDKIKSFSEEEAVSIINNFIPLIINKDNGDKYIEIKVSNKTEGVVDAFNNLDILRRVGLIGSVSLSLSRKDKSADYSFVSASSGEAQLLYSMTAFLRYVSNNCLVIIDEPEISLHPNWQIKYFSLLNLLLKGVIGCHIIIATHSHFLISELDPNTSSLISLKVVKGNIESDNILSSTLGWSPESILYRVFNVRTFNSIYLENDLQKAHAMLYSKDCNFKELEELNCKFKSLVLDESDPLNKFISTIQVFINDNK